MELQTDAPAQEPGPPTELPLRQAVPELPNLIGFLLFNSFSFFITMGTPLILLARHWNAQPWYIGTITALIPLFAPLQLYMAPRVEYIGFKRVQVAGWRGRNLAVGLMTLLPFCALTFKGLDRDILLEALFACVFLFSFLSQLTVAGWLPWIAWLVPHHLRGRYTSLDQGFVHLSSALTFFFCGLVLGRQPTDLRFGMALIVSWITGRIGIAFLQRIKAPPPREGTPRLEPFLIWGRRVWASKEIRRLVRANVMYSMSVAAWETFTTLYLRDGLMIADRTILNLSAARTLGAFVSALVWGVLADRFGSRPVMALSTRLTLVMLVCWLLMAAGVLPHSIASLTAISILFQIGLVGFNVGNLRYGMNNAPKASPALAISFFLVAAGLSNAVAPILWGLFLSALGGLKLHLGGMVIDRFTCFYAGLLACMVAAKILIRRLPDRKAAPTHQVLTYIINDFPLRPFYSLYRFIYRRDR